MWGTAHGPLWDALRKKGRQVRVIGIAVENAIVDRTARVLEAWAAADPILGTATTVAFLFNDTGAFTTCETDGRKPTDQRRYAPTSVPLCANMGGTLA